EVASSVVDGTVKAADALRSIDAVLAICAAGMPRAPSHSVTIPAAASSSTAGTSSAPDAERDTLDAAERRAAGSVSAALTLRPICTVADNCAEGTAIAASASTGSESGAGLNATPTSAHVSSLLLHDIVV